MNRTPIAYIESTPPPDVGVVIGMPNAVYQRVDAVSQTQLKAFRRSPFHYHARHGIFVPDVFATDDETAEKFAGTLTHCATLEPEAFPTRYVVGPDVPTRAAKAWKDFVADNPDRIAITPRQHAVAFAQAETLRRIDAVAEILLGGTCEASAFWIDPATGLRCRCRPDCVNPHFGTPHAPMAMILDVKSTKDASRRGVQASIARYGYHHQCEWYSRGYGAASGIEVAGFIFAFVEADYPFAVSVFEVDYESWGIAQRENRDALDGLAACRASGVWPGYSTEPEPIGLPRWAGGTGETY